MKAQERYIADLARWEGARTALMDAMRACSKAVPVAAEYEVALEMSVPAKEMLAIFGKYRPKSPVLQSVPQRPYVRERASGDHRPGYMSDG